jgi:hypothetical protein
MNDKSQLEPVKNEKNISVKQLQSLSSKLAASKPLTKEVVKALEVFIEKATTKLGVIDTKPKLKKTKTNPDQYKSAWNQLYKNSQLWRQHEIDRAVADKTFGDKDWDKDFIAQIISLAESNS